MTAPAAPRYHNTPQWLLVIVVLIGAGHLAVGQDAPDVTAIERDYPSAIQPLLKRYCHECHAGDVQEADIDLAAFETIDLVRRDTKVWLKIRHMLDSAQMPPKDARQPTDVERTRLRRWVRGFLASEARAAAGDPGPVVLRRLNNAEYSYTVRDLTGIDSLHPTREFPVDGAAGEGFTNAGSAQTMSPALVQKYLDAAKQVAGHMVLLPDGIAFSPHVTQRDQTDELVARIQAFYRQFTADGGGQAVNLQGIKFDTNQGGVLPLVRYIAATLEERDALSSGKKAIAQVARERGINARYLSTIWTALSTPSDQPSPLLDPVRQQWRESKPGDAAKLVAAIAAIQKIVWKFNSVGHIGREGKPKVWMEAVNPIAEQRDINLKMPDGRTSEVSVFLVASDAGDGRAHDYVVWENARLVKPNSRDILLRDLAGLQQRTGQLQRETLARTADYLAAASEFATSADGDEKQLADLAGKHKLDVAALRVWIDYLAIGEAGPVVVAGHFREKHASGTYNFVNGWGSPATPLLVGNSSDQEVRIPGISRPHSIQAHPSPTLFVAAGWQSPISGLVRVEARVADAHPACGNGQQWFVQHRTGRKVGNLWQGEFATRGSAKMPAKTISVRKGELVSFILGPRAGNHTCDLTEINLVVTEINGEKRSWDLAKDCADNLQAANPHTDVYGNAKTWHFYKGEMKSLSAKAGEFASVPANSVLARWQEERDATKRGELAKQVQALATGSPPKDSDSPDGVLYEQLMHLAVASRGVEALLADVKPDERFGKHPLGHKMNSADLVVQAPSVVEFRIPAKLAEGRTLVVTGRLDGKHGREGSVRLEASLQPIESTAITVSSPVVVTDDGRARDRAKAALKRFRDLFPPNLCYARIVPVDEVVTLTLYFREDDALRRLMLTEDQIAELDRLWDELFYVAQEPLRYEVAFEQIREFATQDRPDLVKQWTPLVKGVEQRAAKFRKRLVATQPTHLQAVLEFADRAWRRPLTATEQQSLRALYTRLRGSEIPHEQAMRLLLARVLTSPAFLYKLEEPGPRKDAAPVSDLELATRLSYFLWSSLPDDELRRAAETGRLADADVLLRQAHRMLKSAPARRLAIQFACQWLHLRDFDKNDDKNEKLYPEFAALRHDMYEETVRFFEDMIRNDGSIVDMLDADHTFLNASLAKHYGVQGVAGDQWQRVEGVRGKGRGGILGMATFLASQSGASRTSPILRGNWVFETVLGQQLPRPPADVPQLPNEVPEGLTARELIEKHSSVTACAKCHAQIDPYGFALEQYDAIGRLRTKTADTKTTLADGVSIEGIGGLREYLSKNRRDDFVRQFCRKLLGFSLGRELQLSDEPLIDKMMKDLAEHDYRISVAVEAIVRSDQFRKIRGSSEK